jgi:hypothetical protein
MSSGLAMAQQLTEGWGKQQLQTPEVVEAEGTMRVLVAPVDRVL